MLANGNLMAQGDEAEGRHWATWKDPFPKPSYLFAVVAARLYRALLERFPNDPVAKATLHDLSPSLQPVARSGATGNDMALFRFLKNILP